MNDDRFIWLLVAGAVLVLLLRLLHKRAGSPVDRSVTDSTTIREDVANSPTQHTTCDAEPTPAITPVTPGPEPKIDDGASKALASHAPPAQPGNEKSGEAPKLRGWFGRRETVPKELAENFIKATAWWLTHSSGHPVRAPRHAKRMKLTSRHGWSVEFGANSFMVGRAIERCRDILQEEISSYSPLNKLDRDRLSERLRRQLAHSVANYYGDAYDHYPQDGGQLIFGAQAIDLNDGVRFLIQESDIESYLERDRTQ